MKLKDIHCDDRRHISLIDGMLPGGKEFTIIDLSKNKAIGGCVHPTEEFFCVIDGTIWSKIGDSIEILHAGQSGYIPANYPHMFVGIMNATIIEWGVKAEDKGEHDEKMRVEVNTINDKS